MKAAEERFRNLVEQMPAITYLDVTADDREAIVWDTAYISPQVQEILGYSPRSGWPIRSCGVALLHPDDRERAAEAAARISRTAHRSTSNSGSDPGR